MTEISQRTGRLIVGLIAILVSLQVLVMAAGVGGIGLMDTVRGYVDGEGEYTKAQQRAASALRRYVRTGEELALAQYRSQIAIPKNIALAHIILRAPEIPGHLARDLLTDARVHPADAGLMIAFYPVVASRDTFADAVTAWRRADNLIAEMQALAAEIVAFRPDVGDGAGARASAWLDRIDALDAQLTREQDRFSVAMGEAARMIRRWLIVGIVSGTAVLAGLGVWLGRRTLAQAAASEQTLIERQRRFQDLAECAADWFWETDTEHCFTYISERFEVVTGVPVEQMLGMTRQQGAWVDPGTGRTQGALRQLDAKMARREVFRDVEYEIPLADAVRTVRVSGKPVFDRSGAFLGYRGAGNDVTAEREAQRELKRSKEKAVEANKSKSEFLANMSHELRTPLNAIIGFSDMMKGEIWGPLDPRYAEYARDISASGSHLLKVINDILDLSKVEAGRIELAIEEVDLTAEVRSCFRFMEAAANRQEIQLVNAVPADFPTVLADPQRLRQIVLNLVGNAVKFSDPGGRVRVETALDGDLLDLSVCDEGIGIAANQIEKVLKPFGQADGSLARKHDGVGLGLSLVDRFAQLHGGEVRIESTLGQGTRVRVLLPGQAGAEPTAAPPHLKLVG
ncbi:PAS domain-containing sensor histidine kinase [Rhodovibrio sodomensis]|nr:PAS domain-containing sensor histidine kinase [Rhodovibrio sodomensis]